MTIFEFYAILISHFGIYLLIFTFVTFLYAIILRKRVYSIFDPLFYGFLMSAFGFADVIFLYSFNLIRSYYLISFIATQSAFLIGFLMFSPLNFSDVTEIKYFSGNDTIKVLFYLSSFLFIFAQVFSYLKSGIPILAESRIAIYYDPDFIGSILNKIIPITSLIVSVLAIHYIIIDRYRIKFWSYMMLLIWSIFSILSGAKSNILLLIFVTYTYILFASKYLHSNKIIRARKGLKYLLGISIILALIIVVFLYPDINPLYYLALRMVQSGDTYIYAYPNDIILQLIKSNIFIALFPGFAKLLGIVDLNNMPSLGIELFNKVYMMDVMEGPNARHNVFGLAYLGSYWSVFYSFILGFGLGFVRSYLYRILPATPLSAFIYVVLFLALCGVETDANMAFGNFIGFLSFGFLLIISSMVISKSVSNNKEILF